MTWGRLALLLVSVAALVPQQSSAHGTCFELPDLECPDLKRGSKARPLSRSGKDSCTDSTLFSKVKLEADIPGRYFTFEQEGHDDKFYCCSVEHGQCVELATQPTIPADVTKVPVNRMGLHLNQADVRACYTILRDMDENQLASAFWFGMDGMYRQSDPPTPPHSRLNLAFVSRVCEMVYHLYRESDQYKPSFGAESMCQEANLLSGHPAMDLPDALSFSDCFRTRFVMTSLAVEMDVKQEQHAQGRKVVQFLGKMLGAAVKGAALSNPFSAPAAVAVGLALEVLDAYMTYATDTESYHFALLRTVQTLFEGMLGLSDCTAFRTVEKRGRLGATSDESELDNDVFPPESSDSTRRPLSRTATPPQHPSSSRLSVSHKLKSRSRDRSGPAPVQPLDVMSELPEDSLAASSSSKGPEPSDKSIQLLTETLLGDITRGPPIPLPGNPIPTTFFKTLLEYTRAKATAPFEKCLPRHKFWARNQAYRYKGFMKLVALFNERVAAAMKSLAENKATATYFVNVLTAGGQYLNANMATGIKTAMDAKTAQDKAEKDQAAKDKTPSTTVQPNHDPNTK